MSVSAPIFATTNATSSSSAWIAPTIVLSILALVVSVATFFVAGRRARLDRQRQIFGDAFAAVMASGVPVHRPPPQPGRAVEGAAAHLS
jgi:hypothetical protein